MGKSYRKCAPKASPRPLSYFGRQLKTHCMQGVPFKITYFEREFSKTFKNVNFIFSFEPSPF